MHASRLIRFIASMILVLSTFAGDAAAADYEEVIYYHNDALGSPILATGADGELLWREDYSPYGSRLLHESRETDCSGGSCRQIESPWDEKQWFTGKLEETPVGVQYFGARWYEPEIGRFWSVDPVEFDEGNIFSFNRYVYANANPYRYVDPDGRSPIDVIFLAADIGRLVAAAYSGNPGAIQSAAMDVAFSVAGVLSPIPGLGKAAKVAKAGNLAKAAKSAGSTKKLPVPTSGQKVYRVFGGDSSAGGASWSPVNPARIKDYRNLAGLPSGGASGTNNHGRFVIEATLQDPSKVVRIRSALPLDGNVGGIPEFIIPNALENNAVKVKKVSGVNPEF
jgi:RHS repeat-associated protein